MHFFFKKNENEARVWFPSLIGLLIFVATFIAACSFDLEIIKTSSEIF